MYGRQVTPEKLGNTKIPEIPKWVYEDIKENFENIQSPISKSKLNLSEKKWKYFIYGALFEVKKGKRLVMSQMNQNGKYPFVSSIDDNNGVSCKVDVKPNQEGNTISVNYDGSVAEAFYQPDPFWALDSVNVLYPKFKLTPNIGMFLVTIIKKEKYRFNYGRKWHKERMEKSKIKLPIDKEGNPDWKFMDDFIKTLNYSKLLN